MDKGFRKKRISKKLGHAGTCVRGGEQNAYVVPAGGSSFYSDAELVKSLFANRMEKALRDGPVKKLKADEVPKKKLTSLEFKRAKAAMLAKKYKWKTDFLQKMFTLSRKFPYSENQCDGIIRAAEIYEDKE